MLALPPWITGLGGLNIVGLDRLLDMCRRAGVALAARSLLHEGVRALKTDVLPPFVSTFVHGLGQQPLSDGALAGQRLPAVTDLLASFGLLGGYETDQPLADAIAEVCTDLREGRSPKDKGERASPWKYLPHLLAMTFQLSDWATPRVSENVMGANLHCFAHSLHALLCVVEPHVLRRKDDQAFCTVLSHLRFLEVASVVLSCIRASMHEGKPQEIGTRQRSHAAIVMLLEQLIQLAPQLGYGDLEPLVPHSLVVASYSTIMQPATVMVSSNGAPDASTDGPGRSVERLETFTPSEKRTSTSL